MWPEPRRFLAAQRVSICQGSARHTDSRSSSAVNPLTKTLDRLGTRNRTLNTALVGAEAATYAARCVSSGLLLALIAITWMIVYVASLATTTTSFAAVATVLLLLLGLPLLWLAFRYS